MGSDLAAIKIYLKNKHINENAETQNLLIQVVFQ